MSARVPQSGGRPWVAAHTWMLNDPDVLLAGNAARAETQADLGGSTTRSASTSAARFRSAHEAGKHAGGQRKGCALCAAGRPGLAVVPEPPEPESGSREMVAEFRATSTNEGNR
ncbi:MAG: hypothetical protein HQ453_11015 [Actinobacteria bacterium]|nr:hypothetical protein [Actinomycetota bacterium]